MQDHLQGTLTTVRGTTVAGPLVGHTYSTTVRGTTVARPLVGHKVGHTYYSRGHHRCRTTCRAQSRAHLLQYRGHHRCRTTCRAHLLQQGAPPLQDHLQGTKQGRLYSRVSHEVVVQHQSCILQHLHQGSPLIRCFKSCTSHASYSTCTIDYNNKVFYSCTSHASHSTCTRDNNRKVFLKQHQQCILQHLHQGSQ